MGVCWTAQAHSLDDLDLGDLISELLRRGPIRTACIEDDEHRRKLMNIDEHG